MQKRTRGIVLGLLAGAGITAFLLRRQSAAGEAEANWTTADIPDLSGKTVVVTGANSGLGYETALALAQKQATVVLAVRSLSKGEDAARQIRAAAPAAQLTVAELDLADLDSVRSFASHFLESHQKLDLLINNAGVMAIPYRETADGFEMQFGTNHLGHFALTGLLLPALLAGDDARVVTVSSGAHMSGRINFDDLQGKQHYEKWLAYGQSKLANLLFAYELQRRLEAAGAPVISVGAHPGYAATNLQGVGPEMEGSQLQAGLMAAANRLLAQSAAMGALPLLYAAVAPDVHGCDYIGPGGLMQARGYPSKQRSSEASYDAQLAARLWQVSEQLTGVHYEALEAEASE